MNTNKKLFQIGGVLLAGYALVALSFFEAPKDSVNSSEPEVLASVVDQEPKIGKFSPNEFTAIPVSVSLTNTKAIEEPPVITGNKQADAHIRSLAEERGYQLQAEVLDKSVLSDQALLQPAAFDNWQKLRERAKNQGYSISIVSAYRSVADQRQIFLSQVVSLTNDFNSIARGDWDQALDDILKLYSIPGYSRHHSGYTVDIQASNSGLDEFSLSEAYTWLSKNNYAQAKRYGFVPNYPPGATNNGPDPEAWEFAWVGIENLYE